MTALYANAKLVKVNVGICLLKMQTTRYFPIPHAESRFNQPRDTGGRFKMSYIGFDGSDDTGIIRVALSTKHATDCTGLDRITHRGPGSMSFHVSDFARNEVCPRASLPQHFNLRIAARYCDCAGMPILVDARATDHRMNSISILPCMRKLFEDHYTGTFAAYVPVCTRVKCFAAAIRRQHPGSAESDRYIRREDDAHPTNKGDVAFLI